MYTFDGKYYTFPGYKKSDCTYVLARDVRDNKFTILSQETAIIVLTEDSNVKINQNGRVETIVKVSKFCVVSLRQQRIRSQLVPDRTLGTRFCSPHTS